MLTGVVLLHGKWDAPPFAVAPLAEALAAAGYRTRQPTLPWALKRLYDLPLSVAFDAVQAEIDALRAEGCARIVLCGHSMGACVALAHTVRHPGIDALALLAPGHFPERLAADGKTSDAIAQARVATAPNTRMPLVDVHQGRVRRLRISPTHYLSYFDPTGDLAWRSNLAHLPRELPTLWLTGDQDAAARQGIDYALAHAPDFPHHRHAHVDADHTTTPALGAACVIDWLATCLD